jgi:hypothetical protein
MINKQSKTTFILITQADQLNLTPMAHINTENKVDALILSRRASQTKIHKTLQPKGSLT